MRKGYLIILIVFIALLVFGGAYIYKIFHYGELANKPFYVALQGFEKKNRPNLLLLNKEITPTFIKSGIVYENKSYNLLGIPTKDEKFPYFWVVTNIKDKDVSNADHVFYIPASKEFYLSCSYLDKLEKEQEIDNVVKEFLRERCIQD